MRWRNSFFVFFFLLAIVSVSAETAFPSEVTINGINIIYDKFDGSTTDFNSLNETQLRNLQNAVLEISSYGKVVFQDNLDIVSMAGSDWTVNFDADVNITNNLVYVDNYNLPGINKRAIITIKGLSYSNPQIYNNGVVCLACSKISYSSGTLVFSTPSFSGAFYAREGPVLPYCGDGSCNGVEDCGSCPTDCGACEPPSGGGGGGGGGTTPPSNVTEDPTQGGLYDFFVFPPTLEISTKKGTYVQKQIRVENNGTSELSIGIYVEELSDYIFPEVRVFSLKPGEKRDIRFDVYVSNSVASDVYLGKVVFTTRYVNRKTNVVLNVEEREALFDIRTVVLKKYINPGGRVRANISLINMGDLRNFDVNLDYKIVDFDKNEYTIKSEQFAINQTYSNVFFLDVPEDIPVGDYVFYAVVSYKDVNATSYDMFVVEKISYFAWMILILIILLIMYLVYRWYEDRKEKLAIEELDRIKRERAEIKPSVVREKEVFDKEDKVPELP